MLAFLNLPRPRSYQLHCLTKKASHQLGGRQQLHCKQWQCMPKTRLGRTASFWFRECTLLEMERGQREVHVQETLAHIMCRFATHTRNMCLMKVSESGPRVSSYDGETLALCPSTAQQSCHLPRVASLLARKMDTFPILIYSRRSRR